MEPYIVLAQTNVLFHGIWKANLKVNESLIKYIGTNILSTPSRACKLILTSTGLSLILLPSRDRKTGRTDQVSFDCLRNIICNRYYPKCLMIIYVDSSNMFNIMACSCKDEKDVDGVCKAYTDRRNLLQHQRTRSHPIASKKISFQRQHRFQSDGHHSFVKDSNLKTSTGSSHSPHMLTNAAMPNGESYGSSQRSDSSYNSICFSSSSDNADDVFTNSQIVVVWELEDLFREPVNHIGGLEAFNVGTQTLPYEDDAETNLMQSLKDDMDVLSDGMNVIKLGTTVISCEEYYRRRDNHEDRYNKKVAFKNLSKFKDSIETNGNEVTKEDNTDQTKLHVQHVEDEHNEDVSDEEDCEHRSIGVQTRPNGKSCRRYAKKQVSATTSNAYKEKLAVIRKRSASTGRQISTSSNDSPTENSNSVSFPIVESFALPNTLSVVSQQRNTIGSHSNTSRPNTSNQVTFGTTLVKPIEYVYKGRVAPGAHTSRDQRVVMYTISKHHHK